MIIKRQKTFARADYEGLDGIARKQLAEKRSQIAKDLLKERAENYQAYTSDLAKSPIPGLKGMYQGRLNFRNTLAMGRADIEAGAAQSDAMRDMWERQRARRNVVLQKRAHARATKGKIIAGGVALGAAGLAAGAGYLYNKKKKKSQENQEADSK